MPGGGGQMNSAFLLTPRCKNILDFRASAAQNKCDFHCFSGVLATPLEQFHCVPGQCRKQMLMTITQTPYEPSMGACQRLIPQLESCYGEYTLIKTQIYQNTLQQWGKIKTEELKRKWIWASCWLSDRQIVCVEIMDPLQWGGSLSVWRRKAWKTKKRWNEKREHKEDVSTENGDSRDWDRKWAC